LVLVDHNAVFGQPDYERAELVGGLLRLEGGVEI
jgi:hypothetical protein